MMGGPGVFGKIIIKVSTASLPVNKDVSLFDMLSYPV